MISLLLMLAGAAQANADQRLSRMTALYDQVCLQTFPDDQAVVALMEAQDATPLTSEQVKITLRDDPGRGWMIEDGDVTALLFIEDPPYHACSLRWPMPAEIGDLKDYHDIADRYEGKVGDFTAIEPYNDDRDDIHIHAVGEQRTLPDGSFESLFVFDQHVTNPERRAAGETGTMLRFVHQYAAPGAR
ncbi:hypothetical protein DFR49_0127 [Hephaestia caeni]|uniref:Uncharacterized protein n=1 Tax=Hephaestia caeni TaxID=645617 RepID=A0A397P7T1_9SPHN|nr:hypothetical protein [Hephaestia caeni]RIA45606.1 hypothetical protein DFR49_0127 [Hephaestia caeni]